MFKILLLLCIFQLQQYASGQFIAQNPSDCAKGKCCPPGVKHPIKQGETAVDTSGLCQYYVCNSDNTYSGYQCSTYVGCITEDGDPQKSYPCCCQRLKKGVKQPEGCRGVA